MRRIFVSDIECSYGKLSDSLAASLHTKSKYTLSLSDANKFVHVNEHLYI